MAAYYAARAGEYERIYHKPSRQAELRAIEGWLGEAFAGRRVLEVACGTGWWTPHAAARARQWLATDLNPETLAVARAKAMPACVRFEAADAYALHALVPHTFDAAFVGCWWSHVPRARLPGWIADLHGRLEPGARVVFVDNRWVDGDSTPIARVDGDGNGYQRRTLDDGSMHEVLKNYPTLDEARVMLGPRAHEVRWTEHPHYWSLDYRLA
jgi:demethylmenaquinone methyltransferase/2-methoxy-6-polyprenyl-1,4-benzoquinol methylase